MNGTVLEGRYLVNNPQVGSVIELDYGRTCQLLPSDWDKAQFRISDPVFGEKHALAVNVVISGRTIRKRSYGTYMVRVRITYVGDGEPDQVYGAWMVADYRYIKGHGVNLSE